MKKKNLIQVAKPYYSLATQNSILLNMKSILSSGNLVKGKWIKKFEKVFIKTTKKKYAVSLNSCTTALQISLNFIDIKKKDVLVPAGSFLTDVSSVEQCGGRPILVDMNSETFSFDLDDLQRKITKNTKAIIWVHLTGAISSEYKKIIQFAKKNRIFLIEDAAQATGASAEGKFAGSFGDVGVFSFFPTKTISTGGGGMLVTNNPNLARHAREMRLFGIDEKDGQIYKHGNDWQFDEIRACVGYHQIKEIKKQTEYRDKIAKYYVKKLSNCPFIHLPLKVKNFINSWYQFPILLDKSIDREILINDLKIKYGIETKGIYRPTHHEKILTKFDDGSLKNTEQTLYRSLCLPIHPRIRKKDVVKIITALISSINKQF